MTSGNSVEAVGTSNTATSSSGNKRKRVTNDDNEVPKAKRGAKAKKDVKPKEETRIEDIDEDLGPNGDTTDVNEETGKA